MFKSLSLFVLLTLSASASQASGTHPDWRSERAAFKEARDDSRLFLHPKAPRGAPILISEEEFQLKLEELSGAREVLIGSKLVRITERGSPVGRELARQYLTQEFQKLGYVTSIHAYQGGANFIAERTGTSGKVLIVSSHLDSVRNAGANDDGSGTIAALLIAQALKGLPLRHTLRFIAFDNEEQGLIGSSAYTKTLEPQKIVGAIQLEMMAFHSRKDGRFHAIDCDRAESTFLTQALMAVIQAHALPLTRVATCTQASDHSSFWRHSIPAIVVSENFFGGDGDPCYHRNCDQVDSRLDFRYASLITSVTASAVSQLLQ